MKWWYGTTRRQIIYFDSMTIWYLIELNNQFVSLKVHDIYLCVFYTATYRYLPIMSRYYRGIRHNSADSVPPSKKESTGFTRGLPIYCGDYCCRHTLWSVFYLILFAKISLLFDYNLFYSYLVGDIWVLYDTI